MAKKQIDKMIEKANRSITFNPLLIALRENDKKNLFATNVNTAFIKTGFHLFDYYFGSVINIHNDIGEIISQEARVGQAAGTFNQIVGDSGAGKTTLAVQLAANIVRQYEHGSIIHYDLENRFDISRAETISKLPVRYFENGGYIIRSGLVGLDIIQESITKLYGKKMGLKEELKVNTGFKDEFGNEVFMLAPTVVIIDSITSVISTTFSPDSEKDIAKAGDLRSNTEGARDAKTIKGVLKDIIPLCKEANIIIYAINHINVNMSMNAFVPVSKQHNFLKQDEAIPGGKTLFYYSCNLIKLTAKPRDDFVEESDGFSGHMVMIEPIKSSTNQSGNNSKGISFEMVFSFKHGFDPLRSLMMYGKEKGIIEGNKTRMKFRDDPSFTFSLKDISKEVDEKPIWESIQKYIIPELKTHLSFVEPSEIKFDDRSMIY